MNAILNHENYDFLVPVLMSTENQSVSVTDSTDTKYVEEKTPAPPEIEIVEPVKNENNIQENQFFILEPLESLDTNTGSIFEALDNQAKDDLFSDAFQVLRDDLSN